MSQHRANFAKSKQSTQQAQLGPQQEGETDEIRSANAKLQQKQYTDQGATKETTSIVERKFPINLLSQSVAERVEYFRRRIIGHPKAKEVLGQVMLALQYPADDASLIWIVGPSGIGKTTLCNKLMQYLRESYSDEMELDPGMIPSAMIEVILTAAGKPDWSDFYTRTLSALSDVVIEHKVEFEHTFKYGGNESYRSSPGSRSRVDTSANDIAIQYSMMRQDILLTSHKRIEMRRLRRAVERCMIFRRLHALIIDEAHHFRKLAVSGQKLLDQVDTLKSLANVTQVPIILTGTYELLGLDELSDQVARRSTIIHFPRYNCNDQQELTDFTDVVRTFCAYLPLTNGFDPIARLEYYYTNSLGCVGILKAWFHKALVAALADNEEEPFDKYLERTQMASNDLVTILNRIIEGEQRWKDRTRHIGELEMMLGYNDSNSSFKKRRSAAKELLGLSAYGTNIEHDASSSNNLAPYAKPKHTRKPGERSPYRDPVGP